MKRSMNMANIVDDKCEPDPKVTLVERNPSPGGVALVNPLAVAKKSYVDSMELTEGTSNVNIAIHSNARNKLEVIGQQMKNLHELMTGVVEGTRLSLELHNVACNFVKKPGNVYHLYERPSGQKYFGMLSPEEWQNPPHNFLGSFYLEADLSWSPLSCKRNEGVNFLMGSHLLSLQS